VLCCFGWRRRRAMQIFMLAGVAIGLGLCTGCGVDKLPLPGATSTVSVIATNGSMQPTASFTLTVE
jgi:hypothetical protein